MQTSRLTKLQQAQAEKGREKNKKQRGGGGTKKGKENKPPNPSESKYLVITRLIILHRTCKVIWLFPVS